MAELSSASRLLGFDQKQQCSSSAFRTISEVMVELLSLKFVNFAVRFQILSISVLPSQWGTHTLLCHAAKTRSSLYLEDNMLHHFKEKYEKKCKFYLRECRFQGKSCGGSYTVAVLCCPWDAFCSCSVPVPLHVPMISFTSHDIRQRQK